MTNEQQAQAQEQASAETQQEPIAETTQEQPTAEEPKKPCDSCTMDYINKSIKRTWFFMSAAIIGIIVSIWALKKFENANKLFYGIVIGFFGAAAFMMIQHQVALIAYKDKFLNKTQPTA